MSYTRAQAITYIATRHAHTLTTLSIAATDTTGSFREPIDHAMRRMDIAWSDIPTTIVSDDDSEGFIAWLDVYVLERLVDAAHAWVDLTLDAPDVSKKYAQVAASLERRLKAAQAKAEGYGLGTVNSWQAPAALSTDFLEPSTEEVA